MTTHMTAAVDPQESIVDLTSRIRALGMWWELDGDDVCLDGNTEALSEALLAELRARKPAIAAYLREQLAALAQLEGRLERGWALCEAETDLPRRNRYDGYWIALLHDYEACADTVAALFGEAAMR